MFYGWKLSLLSMGGNFMLQGTVLYCMNAFMEPLCQINGWTRTELSLSMALAALAGQAAMPLAVSLAARYPLRRLMILGAVLGGAATVGLGHAAHLALFTLFLTVAWVATQICGGVVGNALMSNWFHYLRGRAFGLANAGTSLSGVLLPLLSMALINHYSVAVAYTVLGLLTFGLAPLSWFLVRDMPQDLALFPDGRRHQPWVSKKHRTPAVSFSGMVRMPAGYFMGLAFGLTVMVGTSVMSQMKPRFSDLGLEAYPAMLLACAAALCAAVGKYLWGWVCDRFTPLMAMRLVMLGCMLGMGLGFLPSGIWSMGLFSIVFGVCVGGVWTVLPTVVAYYFGSENFLPAYKFMSVFILLRSAGYPVLGCSHDLTGGYGAADLFFLGLLALSLVLSFFLREGRAAEGQIHHHHL